MILAILLGLDMGSQALIKAYSIDNSATWKFILAILLYCAVPFFLLKSIINEGMGNSNLYWNVLSTVGIYIIASIFFGEKINPPQIMGIILAIAGVYIVSISRNI